MSSHVAPTMHRFRDQSSPSDLHRCMEVNCAIVASLIKPRVIVNASLILMMVSNEAFCAVVKTHKQRSNKIYNTELIKIKI